MLQILTYLRKITGKALLGCTAKLYQERSKERKTKMRVKENSFIHFLLVLCNLSGRCFNFPISESPIISKTNTWGQRFKVTK